MFKFQTYIHDVKEPFSSVSFLKKWGKVIAESNAKVVAQSNDTSFGNWNERIYLFEAAKNYTIIYPNVKIDENGEFDCFAFALYTAKKEDVKDIEAVIASVRNTTVVETFEIIANETVFKLHLA